MLRRLSVAGLLLCGAVLLTAADDKKKKGDKKRGRPNETLLVMDGDVLGAGRFRGEMVNPPGFDGVFTVDLEYQYLEPKKKDRGKGKKNELVQALVREQRQIQQETAAARAAVMSQTDPAAHFTKIRQLQLLIQRQILAAQQQGINLANDFEIKTGTQRVEFHAASDVHVRLSEAPQVLTEKGDIKKFTPAELNDMRSKDPSLPGFEGHLADLQRGQTVQLAQIRNDPTKKKSDTAEIEEPRNYKFLVTAILVESAEATISTETVDQKGKNK